MPNIPQQPILRKVKDAMQGDGQLGHAEVAGQVPAALANHLQYALPNLLSEISQLGDG